MEGNLPPTNGHYAMIAGRSNSSVVESVLEGPVDALMGHCVSKNQITITRAPGAFEIPLIAKAAAESDEYDASIALGAVIRGGTPHFEYVAGECVSGLASASLSTGIPHTFGVLARDTI